MALISEVRDYARSHFDRDSVRRWRQEMGMPDKVVRDFARLTFNGFNVLRPGSNGFDTFAQVLAIEEMSRVSGASLPFHTDILQLRIMDCFAPSDTFESIVRDYGDMGRLGFAFAVSEPGAGSDTMAMTASVADVAGCLILNGVKTFVNNGEYAPKILVAAIDESHSTAADDRPLSLWLIPRSLPGISIVPQSKIGQSILPFASIVFDSVPLDSSFRISRPHMEFSSLFKVFELGRLFACATALGEAQAAMEDAVCWARERTAFGGRICEFQQIQQMLTDMQVKLNCMRHLVYDAAIEYDSGTHDRLSIALMKRYVPAAATEVASDALQILGGRGYTVFERVSSIWQDCRGFQIAEGTDQIMVRIAAPLIMQKYKSV